MRKLILLLPLLLLACSEPAEPELVIPDKIQQRVSDPLRQRASLAKISYQDQIYELLVSELPDSEPLLKEQRDLQVALIERADRRYEYLAQNGRIPRGPSLSAWLNFQWWDADEEELRYQSQEYVWLQTRITQLSQSKFKSREWDPVMEKFGQQGPRMQKIQRDLNRALHQVELELK